MTYKTLLTSKGTTTIPKDIRDQLGVKPGMLISFVKNGNGEYVLGRTQTLSEIRRANKAALKNAGTINRQYSSGDGYSAHINKDLG